MRRYLLLLLAGLLGAAVVVLPTAASSETATINAVNGKGTYQEEIHRWSPMETAVTAGASVTIKNATEIPHGVHWVSGPPPPSCPGVPVSTSETASGIHWEGACTFTTPGTYTFYCTVHGAAMSGSITVNANGTTTTTTTPPVGTQTTTSGGGYATSPSSGSSPQGGAGASGSPLSGSASNAVKLRSSQHGHTVRGSVSISTAGAGARLEVDLLAKSASLASARHGTQVRVGRLVRTGLKAGRFSFSVALNARARGALRRHGRLALTAAMQIKAPNGGAATVARKVLLRP